MRPGASIGNLPPGTRLDAPTKAAEVASERAPLGDRVLAALATWVTDDGTVVEPTTASLAARLYIAAESYERDELNHVLTGLRKRGLLRYEHGPDGDLRWRLSHEGWALARRIHTGVTGFERSAGADRSRDRYARVKAERLGGR